MVKEFVVFTDCSQIIYFRLILSTFFINECGVIYSLESDFLFTFFSYYSPFVSYIKRQCVIGRETGCILLFIFCGA